MEALSASLSRDPDPSDLVFSCCTSNSGRGLHVTAWDISNGGTLRTYRCEGENEACCLCMAASDYLLCGLKTKPLILVWKIDKEQVFLKIACSGIVSDIVCDPTGTYCIGAIKEKINIWEICSGSLLAQLSRHYQPVSSLAYLTDRLSQEGMGYFVSGGRDSLAIVWNMGSVLSEYRMSHSAADPNAPYALHTPKNSVVHIWAYHNMAITGISYSGTLPNVKVATSSLDHTCKLHDLASGNLLCTFLYNAPLSCVALSNDGLWLYVGCSTGAIVVTPLFLPSTKQVNEVTEQGNKLIFTMKEHSKPVTSLRFSSVGHLLVSSSADHCSKVWSVDSRQVLRTVSHKGPVVASLVHQDIWKFSQLQSRAYKLSLPFKSFQKQSRYSSDAVVEHTVTLQRRPVAMLQANKIQEIDCLSGEDILKQFTFKPERILTTEEEIVDGDLEGEMNSLQQQLREMKEVHRSLYSFAMEHLIKNE